MRSTAAWGIKGLYLMASRLAMSARRRERHAGTGCTKLLVSGSFCHACELASFPPSITAAAYLVLLAPCHDVLSSRSYVELALLECYRFIFDADFAAILLRLVHSIRGIGNPLSAVYARWYLARMATKVLEHV